MKLSKSLQASVDAPEDRKSVFTKALCRRVLSMQLAPGAALDELALVKEFGLSRPPIREALRKMAAEGYLVLEANQAPRVTHLSHGALRGFLQAAPLVYDATLQLAAQDTTPETITRLRGIQARYRAELDGDIDELLYLVNALYLELGKMAGNVFLHPSLRRLLIDHARFEKLWHLSLTQRQSRRVRAMICLLHDKLIDAVEARSQKRVSRLIQGGMRAARRWAYHATLKSNKWPVTAPGAVATPLAQTSARAQLQGSPS